MQQTWNINYIGRFTWVPDPYVVEGCVQSGQLACCCVLAGFSWVYLSLCYTLALHLYWLAPFRVRWEHICCKRTGCVWPMLGSVYSCDILSCVLVCSVETPAVVGFLPGTRKHRRPIPPIPLSPVKRHTPASEHWKFPSRKTHPRIGQNTSLNDCSQSLISPGN